MLDTVGKRQGYLSGSIDGDGYSINYEYDKPDRSNTEIVKRVGFTNTDLSILEAFKSCLNSLNVSYGMSSQKTVTNKDSYNISCSNKEGLCVLSSNTYLKVLYKEEALTKTLESVYLHGDKPIKLCSFEDMDFKLGWLAAMLDSEGCILYSKTNYSIRICNTDLEVIEYCQQILESLHIAYKTYSHNKQNKDGIVRKPTHQVCILQAKHILRFSSLVPIQSERKIEKLKDLCTYLSRDKYRFSTEELARMHVEEGLSFSEIGRRLGVGECRSGGLAKQVREGGYVVNTIKSRGPYAALDVNDSQLKEVYDRLLKGESMSQILISMGFKANRGTTIYKLLDSKGYKVDSGHGKLYKLLDTLGAEEIIKRLDLGVTASRILRDAGIETRSTTSLFNYLEKAGHDVTKYRRKKN
jgi:transposase